eukprot:TRINITY_DN4452_c0_g2_i1.p1 TRINITY_DN4452_c0_g2~~TRINITY_DN4452_c0_g2_i1.p1  ORF type:complete len:390 (+),score=61.29 TRINITY_DN4452_c0_g2_i1:105-1274(+)
MGRFAVKTTLAALLATSTTAFIPDSSYSFDSFNVAFQKGYVKGSPEYDKRKSIFEHKLKSIIVHNADSSMTWKRGINEFADLTQEEFKSSGRLGYNRRLGKQVLADHPSPLTYDGPRTAQLPKSLDWRSKGVISSVKDQGHCGSCWAFATTAIVETHAAINSGALEVLSPQQLVSCAANPFKCGGTGGCEGSIPEVAFQYIQDYGMTSEWQHPYTSYFGSSYACTASDNNSTKSKVHISGYQKLPQNDYNAVMQALVNIGPLAVNVQADGWHDYHSGIFKGCNNLTNVAIDHVVNLVGYGTDPEAGGDYWLIRNSWDATWGDKGYIRLHRTSKPECGEDPQPADGTGCSGGDKVQHVCGQCGVLFDASYPLGAEVVGMGSPPPPPVVHV